MFWGINEKTKIVEGFKVNQEEREKISQEIRQWLDDEKDRLHIKKSFLEVRSDPFNPSNVEGLYVLRVEVYP